jgi:hypothetical protein
MHAGDHARSLLLLRQRLDLDVRQEVVFDVLSLQGSPPDALLLETSRLLTGLL